MRFVDRTSVPAPRALSAAPFEAARHALSKYLELDEKERAQTRVPDRSLPDKPSILAELVALFDGKCAFCEAPHSDLQPYRFRPPQGIDDPDVAEAHIYYAWMSHLWQNLYPICPACRPSEPQHFPVAGRRMPVPDVFDYSLVLDTLEIDQTRLNDEAAILLDPCADEPFGRDLSIASRDVLAGQLAPLTPRGRLTIRHFDLNRADLVRRRREAIEAALLRHSEDPDWRPEPDAPFYGSILYLIAYEGVEPPEDAVFDLSVSEIERAAPAADRGPVPERDEAPRLPLRQIEIRNFKALAEISLSLPPAPSSDTAAALLILGENATGKSSLLEAIALAASSDECRAVLAEAPRQFLLDPAFMGVEWMPQRATAEVALTFASETESQTTQMNVTPEAFIVSGPPPPLPLFAYGAYRHYKSVQREWRPDRAIRSLFQSDDLLSNPEKWLLSLPEDRFDMVVRALRVVMGGGFRIIQREAKRCLVIVEQDGVSMRTPLDTVSSGFRTILALSCDMMRWLMMREDFTNLEAAQAIVLIDEVEAHLHPRWKVSIMDGLRRAFPAMTFIVTTHDPLCLRGMRDGEVMVLQRVPGERRETDLPVFVDTLRELPDVTKLTVEQLLTSDLFDLFDTDDPRTGHAMADLADALAASRATDPTGSAASEDVLATLKRFREEVQGALPVGSTEVARIVEEAVAEYIREARNATEARRRALRAATKAKIKRALAREEG